MAAGGVSDGRVADDALAGASAGAAFIGSAAAKYTSRLDRVRSARDMANSILDCF
jgi:hypothetical protein